MRVWVVFLSIFARFLEIKVFRLTNSSDHTEIYFKGEGNKSPKNTGNVTRKRSFIVYRASPVNLFEFFEKIIMSKSDCSVGRTLIIDILCSDGLLWAHFVEIDIFYGLMINVNVYTLKKKLAERPHIVF